MGMVFGVISEETPKFILKKKHQTYEIRQYGPIIVAETELDDQGMAFRRLAGYIGVTSAPQNKANNKIAMTAPVITETAPSNQRIAMTAPVITETKDSKQMMSFTLPSKFSMENTPVPIDSKVRIRQMPAQTRAVMTFAGSWDMTNCGPKVKELIAAVKKDGYLCQPETWKLLRYNPPFSFPWMRTNEVTVDIVDVALNGQNDNKANELA